MSTVDMMDVEVPIHGTVVVEDGNVYDIESERTDFVSCTCRDGKHSRHTREYPIPGIPHLVGVTVVKVVWEPEPDYRGRYPFRQERL